MSQERRAKGILVAVVIWCLIVLLAAASYKFVIQPYFSGRLEDKTRSKSQYDYSVAVALDSFSGYSILRSPVLQDELKAKKIRLDFQDDGADYRGRIKALRSGKAQMAVFTIDSFLATGAELGEYPASIVLIIDETQGADGIVAYKEGLAKLQDLDHPEARFVLTPDSPSEFLARIVLAQFSLPSMPEKWAIEADGAEDVYKRFRAAKKTDKRAFVLWEPYVSAALAEDGAHVLLDSSQLRGYIVDVLVAGRKFLAEHPEQVADIVEAYLRTAYSYSSREGGMTDLVMADAKTFGDRLQREQAEKLVKGIRWKNTIENYAHFGLESGQNAAGIQHLEDIIPGIVEVLLQTGKLERDPVGDKASTLFYDKILRDLRAADFHPSRKLNLITGVDVPVPQLEAAAKVQELPPLNDAQWQNLAAVGEMRIKPIAFARGTARLNVQSERELAGLAKRLQSLPGYYVRVVGHARAEGDPEANRRLAEERAQAAAQALLNQGLQKTRVRATATAPTEENGAAQSVSFEVGRPPY